MLDARYVHLHEALGLGPMWLPVAACIRQPEKPVADAGGSSDAPERPISLKTAAHKVQATDPTHPNTAAAHHADGAGLAETPPPASRPAPAHAPQTTAAPGSPRLAALQRVGSTTLEPAPAAAVQESPAAAPTVEHYLERLAGRVPAARLMVLSVCPSPADVAARRLFSGAEGELLDKMLAAIRLSREDSYLSCWLKGLPDFRPQPAKEDVAAASARVDAEFRLSGARALLLMGRFFERDDVRDHLRRIAPDVPHFYIDHPQQMLHKPQLKRKAWEELQKLQAAL